MQRHMLKSKIHRATVTGCDLHYAGSITIDSDLMEQRGPAAGRAGARARRRQRRALRDLCDRGRARRPGRCWLNGAAARLVQRGDRVIIVSYGALPRGRAGRARPQGRARRRAQRRSCVSTPTRRHSRSRRSRDEHRAPGPRRSTRRPPAGDRPAAGRDEALGRADRDGHRLRLPERPGRRGGRRRRGAGRRLRRDDACSATTPPCPSRWTRW